MSYDTTRKDTKESRGIWETCPAFLEGAEYALNNQWISVEDDLPCNHKELINTEYDKETIYVVVVGKGTIVDTDCMEYNGKKRRWQSSFFSPTHWMPAPKLPKE